MQVNEIFDITYPESVSTIFQAARTGNVEQMGMQSHRSFRVSDNKGRTPLHYAVTFGQVNAVAFLLQREEVDVNDRNHNGETALHDIASSSNISSETELTILKQLLQVPNIDVNVVNNEGMTALHYSCQKAHLPILKELLDTEEVNQSQTSYEGLNAIHYLFEAKNHGAPEDRIYSCLQLLIAHQPNLIHDKDERGLLPFVSAITAKLEQCALHLIPMMSKRELICRAIDYSPISIAAGRGLIRVVEMLIDFGAKVELLDGHDKSLSPLQMACISDAIEGQAVNYPAVVSLLLRKMDNKFLVENETLENPFTICISTKSWSCLKLLIGELQPFKQHFFEYFVFADWLTPLIPMRTVKESPMTMFIREASHNQTISHDILQFFLKRLSGLDPEDMENLLPSILALGLNTGINQNSKKVLDILVENGICVPKPWIPVLLLACDIRIILWALQRGDAGLDPEDIQVQNFLPSMNQQKSAQVNGLLACYLSNQCLGTKYSHHQFHFHESIAASKLYSKVTETSSNPYSLTFLCRKELRKIMRKDPSLRIVSRLPLPVQEYVKAFPDLDVEMAKSLYKECKKRIR